MNTKQLIILWYGAIITLIFLLSGESSTVTLSIVGVVVLLLLIYSLGPHHRASKHKVLLAVVLPILLVGIGSFVFEGSSDYPGTPVTNLQVISPQSIELTDTHVHHAFFMDKISGQIKNNSSETIRSLVIQFNLNSASGQTEQNNVTFKGLSIAPGSTWNFNQSMFGIHPRLKNQWKWSFQILAAVGSG
jgi:hypothetical protein